MIRTVLDWETAYGKHPVTQENITLSRMTTEEYIRHPLFKAHGLGVKINQERTFYIYGEDLLRFLRTHPWHESFVIAHNSHFDLSLLSWRAGIRPAFIGCTRSMAKALFPHEFASLNNIAGLLGVGEKGKELIHFSGKWELTPAEQQILGGYCINDVDLTADIFDAMKGHFPVSEMRLIDWTIRCFSEPVFEVDPKPLVIDYKLERRRKRKLIAQCVSDKKELASNEQFAALLLTLGVDPPKKISPAKIKDGRVNPDNVGEPPRGLLPVFKVAKGMTAEQRAAVKERKRMYPWSYAFGKTDEAFKMLAEHEDPHVCAVIEARMGVKSTIKETRSKRFYKIGKRGAFPVYLNYYGAHTNRWCVTGDTKIYVLRRGALSVIHIKELRIDDLVWDGAAFVSHDGLVCRGQQEVIAYDGITGTKDHKVFCDETAAAIPLSSAAACAYTLKVAQPPTENAIAEAAKFVHGD